MISFIEGEIAGHGERYVIVEVGGIGYKVFVSSPTKIELAKKQHIKLFTHLHVREDAMELFGFLNQNELEFFEHLISISGIGPKSALGVIALAPVETLKRAIASGDTSYLTKISGIGRKTAEKIVLELKDKFDFENIGGAEEFAHDADVLEALISLGYTQHEAREMVKNISGDVIGRENRLKEALRKK